MRFRSRDTLRAVTTQMWRGRLFELLRLRRAYTRRLEELDACNWATARPQAGEEPEGPA
jgi:hypothetical protein